MGLKPSLLLALASSLAAVASPTVPPRQPATVDYVIVGGGPAGFVIAEYLTRKPSVTVTLLEAGADMDPNPLVSTPAKFAENPGGLWMFFSEPEPNLGGRTPDLGQGYALGGGSAINAMIYCRGSASVFDEWARVSGNPRLSWNGGMLDAFKATSSWKDEATITYNQPVNASVFGNGPLQVSRQRELFAVDQPLVNTLQSTLGLPQVDFASGPGIGVSQGINTIRASNRTRSYAYNTFGFIANSRPNFKLLPNALVSKIGFTGTRADRVIYNDTATNTMKTIRGREIIVAAGAVKSPQLLMLSGVGPAAQLNALGIPVVKNVPQIGQNLVDHHNSVVSFAVTPAQKSLWQYQYNATVKTEADAAYLNNGNGILGAQWGDAFACLRLPDAAFNGVNGTFFKNLPADRPHVAYEYIGAGVIAGAANVSSVSAWVGLIQPEAAGNVTLKTANYLDHPTIHANYFGSPADKAAVMYGYKQLRSIMKADALKPLLTHEIFPGEGVTSDADIWKAIQTSARSWHHPVGTVALGTVLDANWRVKGLQGLRVVGSPAMPYISTCPIQSTVYAAAHVAAKDIVAADQR
ncbi:choline dehydrogenase [Podospora didyma]|uniref:Choline dehydrogenase n=1 Tax=Podospora didyma TaxID=330526 RepID=A0AAE0K5L9_9PEZI|nr:choline dehydrogenase [Podospora didyma]